MKTIITNAFSINMLEGTRSLDFIQLTLDEARKEAFGVISAVGHADTAAVFSQELGFHVPCNRITVTLDHDTQLLVGQYKGPRLPEGCKELPEGATIEWWLVR